MATLNAGSGADGNATVASNTNLNTASLIGRGYADMISYNCSSVGSNSCVATVAPNGIVAGDEVLLISLQGTQTNYANVGNYETFIVDNINVNTITFTTPKSNNYGNDGGDTNIGTATSNQRVMVQRVPQYENLTINNGFTLTADSFINTKNGVLFIRASDTVLINGSINMVSKGYRGGVASVVRDPLPGYPGEGIAGIGPNVSNTDNHGGGCGFNGGPENSAGGGYGTAGYPGSSTCPGGTVYGEQTLQKLFMGGGGGGSPYYPKPSGDGGGIIAIFATTVDIYGTITADGYVGAWRSTVGDERWMSGCSAGASILIHAGTIYTRSSTFTAIGGQLADPGETPYHAGGGDGRIAISYAALGDNLSAIDPVPYTDSGLELPYTIEGAASGDCSVRVYDSSWVFVKTQAVSAGSYQISNLPNAGPFFVIADPGAAETNLLGYKGVVPTQ
jgi:hypothetical protein